MTRPVEVGRRVIVLGGEAREYRLLRSSRRTLGITVEPGGTIAVTAPEGASLERIEAILQRRREWLVRRTREASLFPPPPAPREWVSGETHRYLGRQYRLKVSRGQQSEVRLTGRYFRVTVPEPANPVQVKRLVERWYLEHARLTFARRMTDLVRARPRLRLREAPPLIVRRLRTRWGSCSLEGRILMNVEAVRLPVGCIDYLLMHELCHLRVPHHGAGFWRLLDACMPDWERWRERLVTAEI